MGCTNGSLRIVRLPLTNDEDQVALFHGHRGSVNAVAFSESGSLVASGGRDTEIVVWDLIGESGICRLTGHKGEITSLGFIPGTEDDFLVSTGKDGLIKIWSLKLQICVQTLTESKSEIWSLCFHGTDKLIVGSSDKVLYVYKIRGDKLIKSDGLTVVEFYGQLDRPESGDGRVVNLGIVDGTALIAQTDRRVVEIWRIVSDESERVKRMKRRVKRAGTTVSTVTDDSAAHGEVVDEVCSIQTEFRASDDFVIASSPESPSVALRYIANGKLKSMSVVRGGTGSISIALGLSDNQIEVFRLALGGGESNGLYVKESKMIKREGHRDSVCGLSVSTDNSRLVSVSSESIICWNAISLAFQKVIHSPSGEIVWSGFVPGDNDTILIVTRDGHLCCIDVNTGLLVGSPLMLWPKDAANDDMGENRKKSRKNLHSQDSAVKCVTINGSRLYIGTKDKKIILVDIVGQFDLVIPGGGLDSGIFEIPDEPVSISVSPKTGTYIAIGLLNSNIEVIYADSGKHHLSLYAHKLPVTAVAFSPDEQVIVSGSVDKNLKVWSIKFGNVLKTIRAHDAGVSGLKFIPHSHLVWSTARDGVVSLWDIDRFERVLSKVNHASSEILSFAMSRDAGMIFTGGSDKAVKRLTRSEDQMFIEEEMEKAMELEVEGEAQRDDIGGTDMTAPTKSSIESIRLVEKVIEMIEIDEEELADVEGGVLAKKKELVKFVCVDIPPSELQQVVVSLPTGHARRLLAVIAEILENARISDSDRVYPSGFPVEACVSAGLFLIQAQAKYLLGEPHSRQVLLRVKELFHEAISREVEHIGVAAAGLRFL